jgi:hypothetical protein
VRRDAPHDVRSNPATGAPFKKAGLLRRKGSSQ